MRKVVAGALTVAALSWAGVAGAEGAKQREPAAGQQTSRDSRAPDSQAMAPRAGEPKHPLFEGKNNFDVKGKIQEVSADAVTIQRDELPAATLHVSPNTKIEVDGKKVSTQELKQGQDVKASFNLSGDKVEAVEIKADQLKKDDRKEMREQSQENREKMHERARESQQGK